MQYEWVGGNLILIIDHDQAKNPIAKLVVKILICLPSQTTFMMDDLSLNNHHCIFISNVKSQLFSLKVHDRKKRKGRNNTVQIPFLYEVPSYSNISYHTPIKYK